MSRSYKKSPWCRDRNPWMKNYANKRIRRKTLEDIPDGNAYRKYTCPWNICDWSSYYPYSEWLLNLGSNYRSDISKGRQINGWYDYEHHWKKRYFLK